MRWEFSGSWRDGLHASDLTAPGLSGLELSVPGVAQLGGTPSQDIRPPGPPRVRRFGEAERIGPVKRPPWQVGNHGFQPFGGNRLSEEALTARNAHSNGGSRETRLRPACYKGLMPSYRVESPQGCYSAVVERGILAQTAAWLPPKAGKLFVVSTEDVWRHKGPELERALGGVPHEILFLPGGEEHKRLQPVEDLAERMVQLGGDRSSVVIAFGGGIVNDMAGFLAAIFMRGIPVLQAPTTLLAQVDASIGGKTGVNLVSGKNLVGSFHPPCAVLIDPALLDSLPEREYRAGLYEILKAGIIRDPALFAFLAECASRGAGARAGSGGSHHRRFGAHEGGSGLGRRARRRSAPHSEFRPHLRPRAGGRNALHTVPARRGGGLGHARRHPPGRGCRLLLGRGLAWTCWN